MNHSSMKERRKRECQKKTLDDEPLKMPHTKDRNFRKRLDTLTRFHTDTEVTVKTAISHSNSKFAPDQPALLMT